MRGFENNNCRLCDKIFCCPKCRKKHETVFHKVFPECDICVYGKFAVTGTTNESVLSHLNSSHFPLHCVYCKKIYNSVEDILQHRKCSVLRQPKEISPKTIWGTPGRFISPFNQSSPIFQELQQRKIFKLATSTPMHRGAPKFEKSNEISTPVDKSGLLQSIIKKTDSMKSTQSSQRRVTFSDTPGSASSHGKINSQYTSEEANLDSPESLNTSKCSPSTPQDKAISTREFYSAKTDVEEFYSAKSISSKHSRIPNKKNESSSSNTPVGVPSMSKFNNVKTDICTEDNSSISTLEDMDFCTPERRATNFMYEDKNKVVDSHISTSNENVAAELKKFEYSSHSFTPAKSSKIITVKGQNIYKELANIEEGTKEDEEKEERQELCIDKPEGAQMEDVKNIENISNATHCNTMWLSAIVHDESATKSPNEENVDIEPPLANNLFNQKTPDLPNKPQQEKGVQNKVNEFSSSSPIGVQYNEFNIVKIDVCNEKTTDDDIKDKSSPESQDKNTTKSTIDEDILICCASERKSIDLCEEKKDIVDHPIATSNNNVVAELRTLKYYSQAFTPDKSSKAIAVKEQIYKELAYIKDDLKEDEEREEKQHLPIDKSESDQIKNVKDIQNTDYKSDIRDDENARLTHCKTMWLSAVMHDESAIKYPDEQNNENKPPLENNSKTPHLSDKTERKKRVSVVVPTPILKETNVKMKINFQADWSSTPIITNAIKIRQTQMVEQISSSTFQPQTPFKTPQGKISNFFQEDLQLQGSSKEPNQAKETLYPVDTDLTNLGVSSVSSMTESSLWTSMTRIVKSVFSGFGHSSPEKKISSIASTSFKRPYPDSDYNGLTDEPCLKRYKFADIKCRRSIRNLPPIHLRPRGYQGQMGIGGSIEFVKSISTVYGGPRLKIQCDKATQTDDYLMDGWQPKI